MTDQSIKFTSESNAPRKSKLTLRFWATAILGLVCCGGPAVYVVWVIAHTMQEGANIHRAHIDVKRLENAVISYHTARNKYPDNLQLLTKPNPIDGSPALLDEKGLIDPWGNPYMYDPAKFNPKRSAAPRIWSNGPPIGPPIGNWSAIWIRGVDRLAERDEQIELLENKAKSIKEQLADLWKKTEGLTGEEKAHGQKELTELNANHERVEQQTKELDEVNDDRFETFRQDLSKNLDGMEMKIAKWKAKMNQK